MKVELSRMQIAILANLVENERTSDEEREDNLVLDIGEVIMQDLANQLIDSLGTSGDISLKEEYVSDML